MVKALFDTNILIDYLSRSAKAREELGRFDDAAISIVTWIEVMVGASPDLADGTRRFLQRFQVIAIDAAVAEAAVRLRRSHRIKLTDAVIWASATSEGRLLITRNTKDFPSDDPGVRLPYTTP